MGVSSSPATVRWMGRGPSERWLAPSRISLLIHRPALCGAAPLMRPPARPPARERVAVTILVMDAYAKGGVVRSVLTVAGYLARSHDVEVVSVTRGWRRKRPAFEFPDGVRVTILDDRRAPARGGRRLVRGVLRRFRSRLLHPADQASRNATVWTDLLLARRLRRLRSGVVITTRPGFNLIGGTIARPGVAVIGQ